MDLAGDDAAARDSLGRGGAVLCVWVLAVVPRHRQHHSSSGQGIVVAGEDGAEAAGLQPAPTTDFIRLV